MTYTADINFYLYSNPNKPMRAYTLSNAPTLLEAKLLVWVLVEEIVKASTDSDGWVEVLYTSSNKQDDQTYVDSDEAFFKNGKLTCDW